VVSKVRKILTVSKQVARKFVEERISLRKLNELEVRRHYQIKISNRLAALEKLSDSKGINMVWKTLKKMIKTSAKRSAGLYQLKHHKP
jgi:hypothetical protein